MIPSMALRVVKYASAAGVLALGAVACASYDPDDHAGYDAEGYRNDYYQYPAYRDDRYYRYDEFYGVNGARIAHSLYSDRRAEELDGRCETHVALEQGETLSDIAEYCDVSVAAILDHNPGIIGPHHVDVGQVIRIPAASGNVYEETGFAGRYDSKRYDDYLLGGAPARSGGGSHHIVRPGDTLAEIALRYDVPLRTIAYLNPHLEPRRLEIGQEVRLPEYARIAPAARRLSADDYVDYGGYDPLLSISPPYRSRNGEVRIVGEGLPQRAELILLYGPDENELAELKIVETDRNGRVDEMLRLPDHYPYDNVVFAIAYGDDRYVMSERYAIESTLGRRRLASTNSIHLVREGQTLAWIANRYDISMRKLIALNPETEWRALRPNQRLKLPHDAEISSASDISSSPPVISSVQRAIVPGEKITLAAEGFPPNAPVAIYAGPDRNSVELVRQTRSGPDGSFVVDAPVPASISGSAVFFVAAVEDGGKTVLSEEVRVISRDERRLRRGALGLHGAGFADPVSPTTLERGVEKSGGLGLFDRFRKMTASNYDGEGGGAAIAGVLTDEGEKCPTLRDDAGNLYTLLGDLDGFRGGDRVLVRGSARADDRICAQAKTVQVFEIEAAPW